MSIIKRYTNTPSFTCDFGNTESKAIQNKVTTMVKLASKGAIIVEESSHPFVDPTLRKLKTAKGDYADIYGNITQYWEPVYR